MGIQDVTTTDLKKVLNNHYVLDLGCGAGYYTHEYSQMFFF
jgi:16S rRNA G1207 methylase RsmC